jgi:Flp pilus assembly protein TadB
MSDVKRIFDLCAKLRGESEDRKAGEDTGETKTQALALQSEQESIEKNNAERLTEIMRLKRKLEEMKSSHSQAMAAIQERHSAAQEKYRAEMAKIIPTDAKPAGELTLKRLDKERDQQRNRKNFLVIILLAILFGCGIVAVGLFLSN